MEGDDQNSQPCWLCKQWTFGRRLLLAISMPCYLHQTLALASNSLPQVLGDCGGAYLAGEQPATLDALRAELEAPTTAGRPLALVLCLPAGTAAEEQVALLEGAQTAVAAAAPTHLLVHATRPPAGEGEQRRRLLAEGGNAAALGVAAQSVGLGKADRANQTGNYTTCDPLCQKHVS